MPTELPGGLVTLLGLFAPIIIQTVTRLVASEFWRFVIAVVLSVVTGVAAMAWSGTPWNFTVEFVCVWYTFSSLGFKLFWKPIFQKTGILAARATKY